MRVPTCQIEALELRIERTWEKLCAWRKAYDLWLLPDGRLLLKELDRVVDGGWLVGRFDRRVELRDLRDAMFETLSAGRRG